MTSKVVWRVWHDLPGYGHAKAWRRDELMAVGRLSTSHYPEAQREMALASSCRLQTLSQGLIGSAACRLLTRERPLLMFWNTAYYVGDAL